MTVIIGLVLKDQEKNSNYCYKQAQVLKNKGEQGKE